MLDIKQLKKQPVEKDRNATILRSAVEVIAPIEDKNGEVQEALFIGVWLDRDAGNIKGVKVASGKEVLLESMVMDAARGLISMANEILERSCSEHRLEVKVKNHRDDDVVRQLLD